MIKHRIEAGHRVGTDPHNPHTEYEHTRNLMIAVLHRSFDSLFDMPIVIVRVTHNRVTGSYTKEVEHYELQNFNSAKNWFLNPLDEDRDHPFTFANVLDSVEFDKGRILDRVQFIIQERQILVEKLLSLAEMSRASMKVNREQIQRYRDNLKKKYAGNPDHIKYDPSEVTTAVHYNVPKALLFTQALRTLFEIEYDGARFNGRGMGRSLDKYQKKSLDTESSEQ